MQPPEPHAASTMKKTFVPFVIATPLPEPALGEAVIAPVPSELILAERGLPRPLPELMAAVGLPTGPFAVAKAGVGLVPSVSPVSSVTVLSPGSSVPSMYAASMLAVE